MRVVFAAKKAKDRVFVENGSLLGQEKENFDSEKKELDEKDLPIDLTAYIYVLEANL
ncbi:hypothetical protein DSL72_004377 [Monilinia vaccinii-corymbosi]|uniref:Uncharacterized protein n=1 Tax=Monilinia vaccinii-corymbosi TaxID=61207 RepID=A0A8A3P8R1_9HELO|nr:hypothetical protein DSL72_004377 [Monilinia vaccinii-corymbosi]